LIRTSKPCACEPEVAELSFKIHHAESYVEQVRDEPELRGFEARCDPRGCGGGGRDRDGKRGGDWKGYDSILRGSRGDQRRDGENQAISHKATRAERGEQDDTPIAGDISSQKPNGRRYCSSHNHRKIHQS